MSTSFIVPLSAPLLLPQTRTFSPTHANALTLTLSPVSRISHFGSRPSIPLKSSSSTRRKHRHRRRPDSGPNRFFPLLHMRLRDVLLLREKHGPGHGSEYGRSAKVAHANENNRALLFNARARVRHGMGAARRRRQRGRGGRAKPQWVVSRRRRQTLAEPFTRKKVFS